MTRLLLNQRNSERKMAQAASQALDALTTSLFKLPLMESPNVKRHEAASKH